MIRLVSILMCTIAVAHCSFSDMAYEDLTVAHESIETPECEKNEVWMECPSCEVKCGETVKKCARVCRPAGCHCPAHKGFKRNERNECVQCK